MEKEITKREGKLATFWFFLIAIGPIGFLYFLYLHITKNPLLEELEQTKDKKIPRREHGAMVTCWAATCIFVLVMVGSISSAPEQSYTYVPPPNNGIPDYDIISIEDASFGKTIRTTVRVEYKGYTATNIFFDLIAKDVVKKITGKQKVNAIAIFFYNGPSAESTCLGKRIWAPYGKWEEASNSETGSYWSHSYSNH